jgi:hypothetical protein
MIEIAYQSGVGGAKMRLITLGLQKIPPSRIRA